MKYKLKRAHYGIMGFMAFTTLLATMFAAAYFATELIYRQLEWQLPNLLTQIVNSLLGLFFTVATMAIFMRVFRSKRLAEQMKVIAPILDALEKIARGDFDVQIDHNFRGHEVELFAELATGVNSMAQQLKQMEAMRQEFISNISHEIQSPLTSIRGFARALQNDQISLQERTHYLSIIETESMRLSKLSDNLLALAALEAENMHVAPKPYRLDRQIRSLILACEPQWSGKNIDMDVAAEEVVITADEDLLSQVWVNLIHNSIKFTPAGGRVCMALQQCQEKVEFRITDTGIGIAPEDQVRVFERFFKADKSRNRALGGSGLGLSIAKKIVEMHKGEIGVESQLSAGATFVVRLPVA